MVSENRDYNSLLGLIFPLIALYFCCQLRITLFVIICLEVSVNGSDKTALLVFQGDQVFSIVKVIGLPRQLRLAGEFLC
jgi:hypothetical protein